MRIALLTLFPEMFDAFTSLGVVGRAVQEGSVEIRAYNPRDYATDKHQTVDDRPFGGGAGMVLKADTLEAALLDAQAWLGEESLTGLMSPSGEAFTQDTALQTPTDVPLALVCGRYEGIDQRFIDAHVNFEWSIGDYVISGGELAAMVVIDAIARHIPGTLGNNQSIIDESHLDGRLNYPQYTRPENTALGNVPEVLLSGDHNRVKTHRRREALRTTYTRRPDLLTDQVFNPEDRRLLIEVVDELQEELLKER